MNSFAKESLKTIVVMPAYNAARTLERTIEDIPFAHVDEIILVDDASKDDTVEVARSIATRHHKLSFSSEECSQNNEKILFTVVSLPQNRGYGGNQKNCYRLALEHGADIVVMLHPDYQYDPKLVKYFVEFIRDGYFDVMLGSRIRSRKETLSAGMPLYKYIANRSLTFVQNLATGQALSEWHTGMRAYKREVLETIPFEEFSDDFIFDTQALFRIVHEGYLIGDIPVPCRYFDEASSINFKRSAQYGLLTVWETLRYAVKGSKGGNRVQFLTYIVVGLLGFGVNIGTFSILVYGLSLWYIPAAVTAFITGAFVSFTLQKNWTFRNRGQSNLFGQIIQYAALALVNLAINTGILYVLVEGLGSPKLLGEILSNGLVALWSFFIYKYITFKEPHVGVAGNLSTSVTQ